MRAFVQLRQLLTSQEQFRHKLSALERKLTERDEHFKIVFEAIRQQMTPPPPKQEKQIGFVKTRKIRGR
jgi:uncharacterized membrane protein